MPQIQPIPNKHYFTIGEVSKLCSVETHVLRYWEQMFPDLEPVRRRGKRRYYSRREIQLIQKIMDLLYDKGYTIEGAKNQLKQDNQDNTENPYAHADQINQTIAQLETVVDILTTESTNH
ncbi:MAG: MerR family transcriptional regulator [Acidiferrobacterales bacterium]|nr:MerR family transcriptional regulator [Acidiferrobacterales bacterium]